MTGDNQVSTSDPASRGKAIANAVEQGGRVLFYLLLAPIIGPHDFGLFVIAASGIVAGETALSHIALQAMVEALAKLGRLSPRHISTAFISATAVAAVLSLMLYGVAAVAALACDDPAIGDMMGSLSLLPLLGALTVPPTILLRQQSRTAPLALSRIAGIAIGGLVCVTLARAGTGPWSLVAQLIVERVVEITLLWATGGRHVGLCWSRRDAVSLGRALTAAALFQPLEAAGRYLPALLVGLTLGPVAAGLYFLASQVASGAACLIALPWRSGDWGPAGVAQQAGLRVLFSFATIASMPIFLPAVLEPGWYGAVLPTQILAAAVVPLAILAACTSRPEASASDYRWFGWPVWLVSLAAVIIVAPFGLAAVAVVTAAEPVFRLLSGLSALRRNLGDGSAPLFSELSKGLAAAALAGVAVSLMAGPAGSALQPAPALLLLLLGTVALGRMMLSTGASSGAGARSDRVEYAPL